MQLTFNASGNVSGHLDFTASVRGVVPQGCSTAADCAAQQANTRSVPGVTSSTCTFNGACICDVSDVEPYGLTGTYQTSGTSITITEYSVPTTGSYCVQNNTLTLIGALNGKCAHVRGLCPLAVRARQGGRACR